TDGFPISQSILSYPGGGLVSTVRDLSKWDAALYSERVLKQSILKSMWTPATLNSGKPSSYGFGFGVGTYHGLRTIGHNGRHSTGFASTFTRFIDEKLTVIVLTNQQAANSDKIATSVAEFYLPPPKTGTNTTTQAR